MASPRSVPAVASARAAWATARARKAHEMKKLTKKGLSKSAIAQQLNVGRTSVRRLLAQELVAAVAHGRFWPFSRSPGRPLARPPTEGNPAAAQTPRQAAEQSVGRVERSETHQRPRSDGFRKRL